MATYRNARRARGRSRVVRVAARGNARGMRVVARKAFDLTHAGLWTLGNVALLAFTLTPTMYLHY